MADKTKIEWSDASWNPTRGCSRVSPGCKGCYAERVAMRFSGPGQPYEGLVRMINGAPTWTGEMRLAENMLELPLTWKKGRMVFVDSMSDLFHVGVPFEYVDRVFAMMAMCPQHRFQVLTKRPERMLEYITSRTAQRIHEAAKGQLGYDNPKRRAINDWPLPNVWLGVSAEDQITANERVPLLLATPAAVRWVSAEPLLGNVSLTRIKIGQGWYDALSGWRDNCPDWGGRENLLNWVVAGGESGPKARPSHPDWYRSLRDQCAAAGVPFLFKQWGEWAPGEVYPIAEGARDGAPGTIEPVNDRAAFAGLRDRRQGLWLGRVGKKAAGRLLDGVEHNGFPA